MSGAAAGRGAVRVLIVEDNADDVLLIGRALGELGGGVAQTVLTSGSEAVQWLTRTADTDPESLPHLVFMDVNLPGRTGFEILRELRGHPSLAHLPVIILTTSDQESDARRAYSTGADSFITKPFRYASLKDKVHEAVRTCLGAVDPG